MRFDRYHDEVRRRLIGERADKERPRGVVQDFGSGIQGSDTFSSLDRSQARFVDISDETIMGEGTMSSMTL